MRIHLPALPRTLFLVFVFLLTFATPSVAPLRADERVLVESEKVIGFLKKYCLDCHNEDNSEAERNFQSYRLPLQSLQELLATDEIVAQLTLRQMPPEDADHPSDEERLAILESLRRAISDARDTFASTGGRTVFRRLSNREYENTLATLFDRRVDTLGLTADFPKDTTSPALRQHRQGPRDVGVSARPVLSSRQSVGRNATGKTAHKGSGVALQGPLRSIRRTSGVS